MVRVSPLHLLTDTDPTIISTNQQQIGTELKQSRIANLRVIARVKCLGDCCQMRIIEFDKPPNEVS